MKGGSAEADRCCPTLVGRILVNSYFHVGFLIVISFAFGAESKPRGDSSFARAADVFLQAAAANNLQPVCLPERSSTPFAAICIRCAAARFCSLHPGRNPKKQGSVWNIGDRAITSKLCMGGEDPPA